MTEPTDQNEPTASADRGSRPLVLLRYPEHLAVVRLGPGTDVPAWATSATVYSITATATETSIVCARRAVPRKATQAGPFLAFAVEGTLDFALTGVLHRLLGPAGRGRSIRCSRSRPTTPTGSWCRSATPTGRPRRGDDPASRCATRPSTPGPDRPATFPESDPMSITHPQGFRAAGVPAGLKSTGAKDLALVVNDGPTYDSASVFTANRCKANPVLWSQEVVKDGTVRAVVLNSGGANCYTGPEGFQTTHAVAERVAERPRASAPSTSWSAPPGLIGLTNPRELLLAGVDAAHRRAVARRRARTPPRRS